MNCFSFRNRFLRFFVSGMVFSGLMVPFFARSSDDESSIKKAEKEALAYAERNLEIRHSHTKNTLARTIMQGLVFDENVPSIIGDTEQQELQLDWLAQCLDKTQTALGSCALRKTLRPVADEAVIKKRQNLVRCLMSDAELYSNIEKQLRKFKTAESVVISKTRQNLSEHFEPGSIVLNPGATGGLFAYWDPSQRKEEEQLFCRAGRLYYQLAPGKNTLNKNHIALETSMVLEAGRTALALAFMIGLQGVSEEIGFWIFDKDHGRLDLIRGMRDGFSEPLRHINPFRSHVLKAPKNVRLNRNNSAGSLLNPPVQDLFEKHKNFIFKGQGTWGDRFHAFANNFSSRSEVKLWWLGKALHHVPLIGNNFSADGTLRWENRENNIRSMGPVKKVVTYGTAAGLATAYSYWKLAMLYAGFKYSSAYMYLLFNALNELHLHTIHLAQAVQVVKNMRIIVQNNPMLHDSALAHRLESVFSNASPTLLELLDVLDKDTFQGEPSLFYSRGRVLQAHRLFTICRDELLPAFYSIAEIDAVYAMATNMKLKEGTATPFSFIEFVESPQTVLSFEQCWIPVLDKAAPNSLSFGAENPTKLIITGPNGCGKSTFLKSIGHCVVLPQSWGIAPAAKARMTMIDAVRTCLHPNESLKDGMSTFMAEKSRVDEMQSFILQQRGTPCKMVLLLDEPFKGTVDAESAERIYQFGAFVADIQNAIVCIATHVHKPIELAANTNGAFKNYHVAIKEPKPGIFERQFTLVEGAANWWFDDAGKRSRFIDWLGQETLMIKRKQKGHMSN